MYRILICDDEKDIVSALKIYLSSEGYETLEAYTGKEALALLETQEIHLVLLDIMMPEMDGLQALSLLRETYNLPVILISAKSEDTDKILGLAKEYGAEAADLTVYEYEPFITKDVTHPWNKGWVLIDREIYSFCNENKKGS